jgi:hypothetical protein
MQESHPLLRRSLHALKWGYLGVAARIVLQLPLKSCSLGFSARGVRGGGGCGF